MYTEAGVRNRLLGYVERRERIHRRSRNVFLLVSIATPSIHACLDPNRRLPNVQRCDRDRASPSISPPPLNTYGFLIAFRQAKHALPSSLSFSALEFLPFRVFLERGMDEWIMDERENGCEFRAAKNNEGLAKRATVNERRIVGGEFIEVYKLEPLRYFIYVFPGGEK